MCKIYSVTCRVQFGKETIVAGNCPLVVSRKRRLKAQLGYLANPVVLTFKGQFTLLHNFNQSFKALGLLFL